MRRKLQVLVIYCFFLCFLGRPSPVPTQTAVVTGVCVVGQHGEQFLCRQYTHPEKMRRILRYLRQLESQGYAPVDPERVLGDAYWIQVDLSDGQRHLYRYRCQRYLSLDSHRWKMTDTDQGGRLWYLLYAMDSDAVANEGDFWYNAPKGR